MEKEKMLRLAKEDQKLRDELTEAAMPLLEFMDRRYGPHTYAIVTEERVEIVRGEVSALLRGRGQPQ